MGRRLITKEEQIKRLEQDTKKSCKEIFVKKSFSIMYPAGVLMVSNPDNVTRAMKILDMAMEGIAKLNIDLPVDVTTGYYETYNTSDRTVQNICNELEKLESCVKCDENVKEAIASLLNEWQISWIIYRIKKANILGILGQKCRVRVAKENDITRILIDKL